MFDWLRNSSAFSSNKDAKQSAGVKLGRNNLPNRYNKSTKEKQCKVISTAFAETSIRVIKKEQHEDPPFDIEKQVHHS